LNPLEGFAHIACELLASNDGDGEDFTVGGFSLWVIAMVEYLEEVIEDAEGRDDFVLRGSPLPCVWGLYPCARGEIDRWQVGLTDRIACCSSGARSCKRHAVAGCLSRKSTIGIATRSAKLGGVVVGGRRQAVGSAHGVACGALQLGRQGTGRFIVDGRHTAPPPPHERRLRNPFCILPQAVIGVLL